MGLHKRCPSSCALGALVLLLLPTSAVWSWKDQPKRFFGIGVAGRVPFRVENYRGGATTDHLISKVDLSNPEEDTELLAQELQRCHGEIIDPHLHTAPWFDKAETLVEELEANNISIGLLYNPYPKLVLPYDVNTFVTGIASASKGRVYALVSLNTTHENWAEHREQEMQRLRSALKEYKSVVLGTKLAPPHTCLPLGGPIMDDIMEVVNESEQKLVAIHIGTTPFCGPLGKQFGIECNGGEECVNPALLIPQIERYPTVKFVLLHSGHEFLPPPSADDNENGDNNFYYGFKFTDACISMAQKYDNVYLSMSALFAHDADGNLKYPGGFETVRKMKEAGVAHKVFWGSDASWNRGDIRRVLIVAIKAMIQAGWTEEERTWALNGCARQVFRIPEAAAKAE